MKYEITEPSIEINESLDVIGVRLLKIPRLIYR
jgi:hypothetical protein